MSSDQQPALSPSRGSLTGGGSGAGCIARFRGFATTFGIIAFPLVCANVRAEEVGSEGDRDVHSGEESVPMVFDAGTTTRLSGRSDSGADTWWDDSGLGSLWDLPNLYRAPHGHLLRELRLVGRYHGQLAHVSAAQGSLTEWENRRARLGLFARFAGDLSAQLTYENGMDDKGQEQKSVHSGWIAWRPSREFGLKLGQQKPLWSNEWSTSSRFLLTMERSLLVNQLHPEFSLGAYASGDLGTWAYGVGVYSGHSDVGFEGDAGSFTVLNIGRDFRPLLRNFDLAHWRLDWVYNNGSDHLTDIGFKHAYSSSITARHGKVSLMTNVLGSYGEGDRGNTFGVIVMPAYDLVPDRLQLVARYQFAKGKDDGLVLQKRYEREVLSPASDIRGERYQAIYGGLTYFINGDKLKLMAGVEYSEMDDGERNGGEFDGWTVLMGVRMYF